MLSSLEPLSTSHFFTFHISLLGGCRSPPQEEAPASGRLPYILCSNVRGLCPLYNPLPRTPKKHLLKLMNVFQSPRLNDLNTFISLTVAFGSILAPLRCFFRSAEATEKHHQQLEAFHKNEAAPIFLHCTRIYQYLDHIYNFCVLNQILPSSIAYPFHCPQPIPK